MRAIPACTGEPHKRKGQPENRLTENVVAERNVKVFSGLTLASAGQHW